MFKQITATAVMKLVQVGTAHIRNTESMERMCKVKSIDYKKINVSEIHTTQADIYWCPSDWVNPDDFPKSKFIFGPHFWVFPQLNHKYFTESKSEHSSRCIFTCLSEWNRKIYYDVIYGLQPNIPFLALPFGVETINKPKDILEFDCVIYHKFRNPELLHKVVSFVKQLGLTYTIYKYGQYNKQDYINTLLKSKFCIWIGCHESQGFAFQECLSTNTPIFVLDVKSMKDEYNSEGNYSYLDNPNLLEATSATWFDDTCGKIIKAVEEVYENLPIFIKDLDKYKPLEYFNNNLTDEACANRLFGALNI